MRVDTATSPRCDPNRETPPDNTGVRQRRRDAALEFMKNEQTPQHEDRLDILRIQNTGILADETKIARNWKPVGGVRRVVIDINAGELVSACLEITPGPSDVLAVAESRAIIGGHEYRLVPIEPGDPAKTS